MKKSKNHPRELSVTLPAYSILNKELISELDHLFDLVPPHMLRRSVHEIFWNYLCHTNQEDLHPQFKEIATDFKYLLQFLEMAEKQEGILSEQKK